MLVLLLSVSMARILAGTIEVLVASASADLGSILTHGFIFVT